MHMAAEETCITPAQLWPEDKFPLVEMGKMVLDEVRPKRLSCSWARVLACNTSHESPGLTGMPLDVLQNPNNYFSEVEVIAFNPGVTVPGTPQQPPAGAPVQAC